MLMFQAFGGSLVLRTLHLAETQRGAVLGDPGDLWRMALDVAQYGFTDVNDSTLRVEK